MPETVIRPMTVGDAAAVHAIEAASFAQPWSREAFEKEVSENKCARYMVLCDGGEVVAYAGAWLIIDEGHITNIAVRPDKRGLGYGEAVTRALIQLAADTGIAYLTLECRASNVPALAMYKKLGFKSVGVRKKYYVDPVEDAKLMLLPELPPGDPERDPYLIIEGE